MTVEPWTGGGANPFESEPDGYQPWRTSKTGAVRDIMFFPAAGSGQSIRGESYLQVISWELSADATTLWLLFQTSGLIACIKGQGLGDLIELISSKRAASVHVWHEAAGKMPAVVVTEVKFDRSIKDQLAIDR